MEEREVGSVFALPDRLRAKNTPELIAGDERMFARIAAALDATASDTALRLAAAEGRAAARGQDLYERDLEIRRLGARQRLLQRFGQDICLGRVVPTIGEPIYIGRFGLSDPDGNRLIVDWRAPAAEPFFAASHGHPLGLSSRRRYSWAHGRIVDYWDEVFADDGIDHGAALDDQSAFIASLGASRSPKMRDVLATIQADQDAIVRAGSGGALVVDGGPGTGKTVVALHRAAYLLYADPRLREGRGGLLFVGPHRPYLDYIDDVLPSLGEEGARVATIAGLVDGGDGAPVEHDVAVRRVKADARLGDAVGAAVRLWEKPPRVSRAVPTQWGPVHIAATQWREVFATDDSEISHNALRQEAWDRLVDLVTESMEDANGGGQDARWRDGWGEAGAEEEFDAYGLVDEDEVPIHAACDSDEELRAFFDGLWPALDPDALLRGLWTSERMLHTCAPWLSETDVSTVAASARELLTDVDLPFLDLARRLVGDPRAEVRLRKERIEAAAERGARADVVTHLIAADDSDMRVMSMLRGQDLRETLAAREGPEMDPLAGPFAHVVVDEAQELTDAQWAMLLRRCPTRSFTIVGDRAQARHEFTRSWNERLAAVGIERTSVATLTVGYRTPAEVMEVAAPVIRAVLPDANVPTSIRHSGVAVQRGSVTELDDVVAGWLEAHDEGTAVVVGSRGYPSSARVSSLSPELVKGLEFDLVVLVDPDRFGDGYAGAVDRYVAMTRATGQLVILT